MPENALLPSKQAWLKLELPACLDSLLTIQATLTEFAGRQAFPVQQQFKLELALEELVTTVLRFSLDETDADSQVFRLDVRLEDGFLKVRLNSRGLPFNWSMIPEYDPRQAHQSDLLNTPLDEGLSAFLLKQVVDQYQLSNLGKEGVSIELAWRLAGGHIATLEGALETDNADNENVTDSETQASGVSDEPLSPVRRLYAGEEIQVSRLVYRSYGYTYVDDTLYYPDGIRKAIASETLDSWVVAGETSGELVGHIALMRAKPDDPLVEWGMAVVSPRLRGRGLMKTMVRHLMQALSKSNAQVAFAHAVAIHPYTQKTALEFGFQPTALQLGFAPAIKFKQLDESAQHRESTYISMRFFQTVREKRVYLPAWHQAWLKTLMAGFHDLQVDDIQVVGSDEALADDPNAVQEISQLAAQRRLAHQSVLSAGAPENHQAWSNSQLSSHLNAALNIAQIELQQAGADLVALLSRELYRLSSEKVDVIYLQINLADPQAPRNIAVAETLGFFVSGWMPMSPWPMTLSLQYLNHVEIPPHSVTAASDAFETLKNRVFAEQALIEQLMLSQYGSSTAGVGH
ncbi:GNAT family N-acetyltransferase [Hydrogenovibrio halophilus]|uniref:GNAT family N-acetyltransferase n=1 Tax=Hydrogenovibrio halophilus TaxID=373391 RepID=UPI0003798AE0|nr:GNAT family N-acetyltransferase [Hydrogenovibrio halophilus]